jgi:hypothetical protein
MGGQGTAPGRPEPADSAERLQAELALVEREIEQTRRAAEQARAAIGGRDEGVIDMADRSAAIEQAEEQEELVAFLTARREKLMQRLRALQ